MSAPPCQSKQDRKSEPLLGIVTLLPALIGDLHRWAM